MPTSLQYWCGICDKPITCWGWGPNEKYIDANKYECDGVLCDFADPDGCFNHYCKECFEKHTCEAYDKYKKG